MTIAIRLYDRDTCRAAPRSQCSRAQSKVELDIIIQNGQLLICELKSSIDKAGLYIFERKARFYEQRPGRQVTRLIVISPMIDHRAKKVAKKLGIDTYGDSLDVETL